VRPTRHVIVFVRAPQIGTVKRRLSTDIGVFAAWRFYRSETARLIAELRPHQHHGFRLAVTPDCFTHRGRFWPDGITRIPQGPGNIGERMARVVHAHPHEPVVIIGSDVPGLKSKHVEAAFVALETHDAVIGPAHDGGYWLIGFRQRPTTPGRWRPGLFRNIRWSGPHAMEDTLRAFPRGWRVARLDTLSDVDTKQDFDALGGRQLIGRKFPGRNFSGRQLLGRHG
jgi:rSAM/selenodomain-associated transferase 1